MGGLIRIAWGTAPVLTTTYFVVAVLAGLGPVLVVVALRFLIDAINHDLQAGVVGSVVVGLLAARQAAAFASGFLRYTVHNTLLDTFLRYRVQIAVALRLAEKLVHLDQPLREDGKVQDLIARTQETYLWRTVSIVQGSGAIAMGAVGWLAALGWLVGFGWWVPPLLMLVAVPRLAIRARTGAVHWSMYGAGAPEIRKLYYLQELLGALHAGPELRVLKAARPLLDRLGVLQERLFQRNTAAMRRAIWIEWIPPLVEAGTLFGLAVRTLPAVATGDRTVGELVLFLALCEQFAVATAEVVGRVGGSWRTASSRWTCSTSSPCPACCPSPSDPAPSRAARAAVPPRSPSTASPSPTPAGRPSSTTSICTSPRAKPSRWSARTARASRRW